MPSIDTSYEPFSREAEYIEINRLFVESLDWEGCAYALDLACGAGTLTGFIWRNMEARSGDGRLRVVGADVSTESLKIAQSQLSDVAKELGREASCPIVLIRASADALPIPDRVADAVVLGNAIHIFDDIERLLNEVARVLRPGGIFAFNSSFFAGTFAPGTEDFYLEWMKQAVMYVRNQDGEQRRLGMAGVRRKRGLAAPAFSRPWLSAGQYECLLNRCGFAVSSVNQRTMKMSRRSFETVGAYSGLASVLLSGYPVDLACEALQAAVAPALAAGNITQVSRYWLEVAAVRR